MAFLEDTQVLGGGIEMPLMQCKWTIKTALREEQNKAIHKNVISADIDLVNNELIIVVEQALRDNHTYSAIKAMKLRENVITVQHLDGNANVCAELTILATLVDHDFKLDYSKAEVAKHKLTFEIGNFYTQDDNLSTS
jgi:hypothetical protein